MCRQCFRKFADACRCAAPWCLALAALAVLVSTAVAQQRVPQGASPNRRGTPRQSEPGLSSGGARLPKAAPRSVTFTPEREAAALAFVRNNRPELAPVLEQLQKSKPEEYRRAICDLFWTSEALAKLHDDDPRWHELALKTWKLESQTHYLASQLAGDPPDAAELRKELQQTVEQLVAAQIETSAYELKRQEAQTRRAQDRHKRLEGRRADVVRERMAALTQAIEQAGTQQK
jgi:hypothetical protein